MNDLTKSDVPDLKAPAIKPEAAKPVTAPVTPEKPAAVTKASDKMAFDHTSDRHDAEAKGIANPVHDKQTYAEKVRAPEKAFTSSLDGKQTKVLLMGCHPDEITRLTGTGPWTTIRATRKWFDGVKVGDVLPVHVSIKPETPPSEDTYPEKGDFICEVRVVNKRLVPSLSAAVANSADNHFIKMGRSKAMLEELLRNIYPASALKRAGANHDDGFTILTLEIV